MTTEPRQTGDPGLLAPALVYGFGTSVALWCAWYVTHLPWLGLQEQASLPLLLLVWGWGMVFAGRGAPRGAGIKVGVASGLVVALVGLLALGSKLMEAAPAGDASAGLRPNAGLITLGYLGLGAVLGAVGGAIGGLVPRKAEAPDWLARFALVAAVSVVPLLIAGGLVTSTDSGMAVPDWPNTFGTNMFLYPLGPRARPDVYLEHAHRLFGTQVGLTSIVLMVWVLLREDRKWVRIVAVLAFLLVVSQGILGGARVRLGSSDPERDRRILAMFHGVAAQLIFGLFVALAAAMAPSFRRSTPADVEVSENPQAWRKARRFTTGLLHSMILQLLFGAMYRHFRDSHSLWTHAGFSLVVLIFAMASAFVLLSLSGGPRAIRPVLATWGRATLVVVALQIALGWIAFGVGGSGVRAAEAGEAILRTAHQANGALLLACSVVAFGYTRKAIRLNRAAAT